MAFRHKTMILVEYTTVAMRFSLIDIMSDRVPECFGAVDPLPAVILHVRVSRAE